MQDSRLYQKVAVRISLLITILILGYWSYIQLMSNYRKMELSNRMVEAILQDKDSLAREYAQELGLAKKKLSQAHSFLSDLENENKQLREKIKLLDKLSELEKTIARLKEKNARVINHMSSRKPSSSTFEKDIESIAEGEEVLSQYVVLIKDIKARIRELKRMKHDKKVAALKERDRIESLVGNNGYLVRNGELSPVEMVLPPTHAEVQIKVDFVE